jgi:hypothetical protein
MKRFMTKEDFEFLKRHKFILKTTLTYLELHFPLLDFSEFKIELKNIQKDYVKLNRVLMKIFPNFKQKK